jgi:hypothetical protein
VSARRRDKQTARAGQNQAGKHRAGMDRSRLKVDAWPVEPTPTSLLREAEEKRKAARPASPRSGRRVTGGGRSPRPRSATSDELHTAQRMHAAGLVMSAEDNARRKARPLLESAPGPVGERVPAWLPPQG